MAINIFLKSNYLLELRLCQFLELVDAILFIIISPEDVVHLSKGVFVLVKGLFELTIFIDKGLIRHFVWY